jgi:hypothetical protein
MQELVEVRMKNGSTKTAKIEWGADAEDNYESRAFVCVTLGGKSERKAAFDFYTAFQRARHVFESEGCRFLCYGASLNVWPSGMVRDMGMGRTAYKLQRDRDTTLDDLVPIFESGDDVVPSTVEEQCAYANAWYENSPQRDRALSDRKWWKFWR